MSTNMTSRPRPITESEQREKAARKAYEIHLAWWTRERRRAIIIHPDWEHLEGHARLFYYYFSDGMRRYFEEQ